MLLSNFYIFTFLLNFTFTFAAFIPNDVSKPFATTDNVSIAWVDLTYTGSPLKTESTACIGGKNNDMIFIFGGSSPFGMNQSFINQFDTNKQQWINITSIGIVPTNRYDISCANFDNGWIAIFSGNGLNITNDLWIFNTLTLTWNLSNATNAPLPMYGYCAVTLRNGNILYIGGNSYINSTTLAYMPMNNLPLYNTKSDTWANLSISVPIPSPRKFFSAVLTSNGRRIIIFGGLSNGAVLGDLWILTSPPSMNTMFR
ncbi:hypothetical protein C2G38_1633242 [Gigaspora rosea]|uniref:Galactose oxidase n=1 Tax=Gigaspora rosea TaxID=44941 RepID=A0A397UZY2_9GLOM|nr:hypothetical protein C2G38_1633242 [Gigaspora rosea]